MNISVLTECIGCGICALLCPKVFEIYKDYAIANSEYLENFIDICIEISILCPVNAISFEDFTY